MIRLEVPSDKSLTHRALLLSALSDGESRVGRPLRAEDTGATRSALERLGVGVEDARDGALRIHGVGLRGLRAPSGPIDCGNSGTTARLLMGALAGQGFPTTLTGDASLSRRPMGRVARPLELMGARVEWLEAPDRLPLTLVGSTLRPLDYTLPVASAQVKSALLLAGLTAGAWVLLTEPGRSRDHTERMLAAMGAPTIGHHTGEGWRVELRDPPARLDPLDFEVPGDPSTAAFFLVWALLQEGGPVIQLPNVGLNPTRTGFLDVLERMGAKLEIDAGPDDAVEPTGELRAHPSDLRAVSLTGTDVPRMVDEVPLLAVAACRAEGCTSVRGAAELRVKESDRLTALARNLSAIGVEVEELPDGLDVHGTRARLSGTVHTFGDHRIEMAFAVLASTPGVDIEIVGPSASAVSHPSFWEDLRTLQTAARESGGGRARSSGGDPKPAARAEGRLPVVTIDGPAGSGKSTTARAVARALGFTHLDSGSLYRALTLAALRSGVPEDEWSDLTPDDWAAMDLGLDPTSTGLGVRLDGLPVPDEELRTEEVTSRVSVVAALPSVRRCLLDLQRSAAERGGLVADGRDMGSVVFPDAEVKVFLTADLEERARRRFREGGGDDGDSDGVTSAAAEIQRRDFRDTHREHSPLRRPEGSVVLDTTGLTPEEQADAVIRLVREALSGRPSDGNGGER